MIIIISVILSTLVSPKTPLIIAAPLVFLILFFMIELAYFKFGVNIFDENERVDSIYRWGNVYLSNPNNSNVDLSEYYFKDDKIDISLEQAMRNKHDAFYKLLDLKPGMRVLDVGCGYGQWGEYLRSKGVEYFGIAIATAHVEACNAKGLDAMVCDMRDGIPKEVGLFDAISFMGSLEHMAKCNWSYAQIHDMYSTVFKKCKDCLNEKSSSKKVLFATIHYRNDIYNFTLYDKAQTYLLERHYSGYFPKNTEITDAAGSEFSLVHNSKQTEDYRYASIINPDHFGYYTIKLDSIQRMCYIPYMFLTDIYALHKWLYHICDTWMWQFGGVSHVFSRTRNTPMELKWLVFQLTHDADAQLPTPSTSLSGGHE